MIENKEKDAIIGDEESSEKLLGKIMALNDDSEIKAFLMKHLLESSLELESSFKNLKNNLTDIVENQIKDSFKPFDEKLTALSKSVDIIKEAPDLLASEVGNLNDEVNKVYDNLDSKIKIANNNIEQINASALNTISRAMLESSTEFQRILNASKKEVLNHLKEGTENALKEIGKNSSAELKRLDERVESGLDTISSIAKSTKFLFGICGLAIIINIITLAILVWVTLF